MTGLTMVSYAIYRLDTGAIVAVPLVSIDGGNPDYHRDCALAAWGAETHGVLETGADPDRHYVGTLGGEPVRLDRPAMPVAVDRTALLADGIDFATLTGLPDPCEVVVDDPDPDTATQVVEAVGGGFEFAAEVPGTYVVEIRRFPFLPFRIEFTAA